MISLRRTLALAVLAASAAAPAWSQVTTGTLQGTVKDASGAVVPGATVIASHTQTSLQRFTQTGSEGRYSLPFLPVGAYEVDVQLQGFETFRRREVPVSVGETLVLDATLKLASFGQRDDGARRGAHRPHDAPASSATSSARRPSATCR